MRQDFSLSIRGQPPLRNVFPCTRAFRRNISSMFPCTGAFRRQPIGSGCTALLVAALRGDWKAGKEFLYGRITGNLETALHIAAGGGHREFVEELVKMMMPNELEMQNKVGNTALVFTTASGVREIAMAMVKKNPQLPLIRDSNESMPLCIAALSGNKTCDNAWCLVRPSARPPASATPPCAPAAKPVSERSTKIKKTQTHFPSGQCDPDLVPESRSATIPSDPHGPQIFPPQASPDLGPPPPHPLLHAGVLLAELDCESGPPPGTDPAYSDEEMQEEVVKWWEGQEYWKRNNGRDHVIIAQDPNALCRVVDRIKNAVLLVSEFGRLKPDQVSLVKYVMLPYSHRINT
ncbi:uncharacterized protein LOC104447703 [Eucalyptus grandis]|uniref:uncharacterized protein LOC104447703 n=1 Tax=Eucalyptus grandis TaxID=71139 RepID=UPI00192EED28|nr:uncharacterized protein LOC104447703 [Eucalyptus grandis]